MKLTAEKILEIISRRNFGDFYGHVEEGDECPFSKWLEGQEDALTKEEILNEITRIFHLED